MSNIVKISNVIKSYALKRKKNNPDISCRLLASEVKSRFKVNISKSSINALLKNSLLSSPIGRRVTQVFRSQANVEGAGYSFLYGANLMLGMSKILASCIKKALPPMRLKIGTIETISEAWLMARAIYNVPLQKIENYEKNELWSIIGRKANKGLLKHYLDTIKVLQPINYQLVMEFSNMLQDVHFLRITMADDSQYCLDGQLKTIWREEKIPIDFSVTLDLAISYINKIFFGPSPLIVNYARPQTMLGQDLSDFIFSMDSSAASKRIRKIDLISPNGNVIKESSFIVPDRRRFLIGIWPWQYKPISELEKQPAIGSFFLEPLGIGYYFLEDQVRFSQHIDNKEVMLRLIIIKVSKEGPARLGILTNLKPEDWDTQRIVEEYVRRCSNFEASQKLFLEATQAPGYREEFISGQKILSEAKKLNESHDPDVFFTILVDLMNLFSQRSFFPSSCSGWSLLKMREFVYKQPGVVRRDLSEDISFNLFNINKLGDKDLIKFINFAAVKFNEAPLYDFSGRKLWITTS